MTLLQFLLLKLAEEAGEVSHEAMKTIHFGPQFTNPKTGEKNSVAVNREIHDFKSVLKMVHIIEPSISFCSVSGVFYAEKVVKIHKYLLIQVNEGLMPKQLLEDFERVFLHRGEPTCRQEE